MAEKKYPTGAQILERMRAFQPACVLGAAAELDLWAAIGEETRSAEEIAVLLAADLRATTILLDAVVALDLLEKEEDRYSVPAGIRDFLTYDHPRSVLPMMLHSMTILRNWSQLAWVVKKGSPPAPTPSLRGQAADRAAFIDAMNSISSFFADEVVAKLASIPFKKLLDVGGASGTWTLAFLRARPDTTGVIFDLPDAIEQARRRVGASALADRVFYAAGDFYKDDLPDGADFAWVSAIVHQQDRAENRRLFAKVYKALTPGGTIALRDVVMEPDRTQPADGALFAVNMLVNTTAGGTFTFADLAEDLAAAGFSEPNWLVKDAGMNSLVVAVKK